MARRMVSGVLVGTALLLGSGLFSTAQAVTLNVDNFSFETPIAANGSSVASIDFWTTSSSVGIWDPGASQFGGVAPDGENVAYINYSNGYLEQTIEDYTLTAGSVLTLEADFGWRANTAWTPTFSLALLVDGTVLAQGSTTLTQGTFTPFALTFTVDALSPYVGLNPTIRITNTSASSSYSQLLVDDVHVNNRVVPEPTTVLLLGIGLLSLGAISRRRRRG